MKPTLYAEDYVLMLVERQTGTSVEVDLMPRRCDNGTCSDCYFKGFLYPDPPDWWTARYKAPTAQWEDFCDDVWRVLGIVDTR